ncbi:MAG: hypothetical protein HY928_18160 [Elusimicrobia bacterium]|nr:hypothetical protein [Elusimicrobiota bacterium]
MSAELRLEAAWYAREAVDAAAASLAGRARVALKTEGGVHTVRLTPVRGKDAAALAGDFLDEALNHQLRSELVALARPATAPVLARTLRAGFTAVPKDPLEEMDKALAAEREAETAALAAKARRAR